jgi:hypothetical protein
MQFELKYQIVFVFFLLVLSADFNGAQEPQEEWWLVTIEEAATKENDGTLPVKARANCKSMVVNKIEEKMIGPVIQWQKPVFGQKLGEPEPLEFSVTFEENQQRIDMKSIRVWIDKLIDIDVTERLAQHWVVEGNTIHAKGFRIPCGANKYILQVSDINRKKSEMKIEIDGTTPE